MTLLILTVGLGGCLDPFRPVVPPEQLAASPVGWVRTDTPLASHGTLGPNIVETEYRHTPDDNDPDTPGLLLLIGIRTFTRIDTADLLERTEQILDQALADEGVTVDPSGERRGTRTNEQGLRTEWFTMVGTADSGSPLFSGEEEVRVIGEAWYDGRSKTHMVAVGLVQTTNTNFLGQENRDHTVWDQLVGDDAGTIDGATNTNGFITHVRSHN